MVTNVARFCLQKQQLPFPSSKGGRLAGKAQKPGLVDDDGPVFERAAPILCIRIQKIQKQRYHHEARPAATLTPPTPDWKGPDTPDGDDDDDGAAGADGGAASTQQQQGRMAHDDKFGEAIPDEEREWIAAQIYDAIVLQVRDLLIWWSCDLVLRSDGVDGVDAAQAGSFPSIRIPPKTHNTRKTHINTTHPSSPHQDPAARPPPGAPPPSAAWAGSGNLQFAGSQPVSLDRAKLAYIKAKRYWVTWKADGTRYMLLLTNWGAYLMDRACDVRRVQVGCVTVRGVVWCGVRCGAVRCGAVWCGVVWCAVWCVRSPVGAGWLGVGSVVGALPRQQSSSAATHYATTQNTHPQNAPPP